MIDQNVNIVINILVVSSISHDNYFVHIENHVVAPHSPPLDGGERDVRSIALSPVTCDSGFIIELGCTFPCVVFFGVALPSNQVLSAMFGIAMIHNRFNLERR
jgi:hypothetical protein